MSVPAWVRFARLVQWLACAALLASIGVALYRREFPGLLVPYAALGTTLVSILALLVWFLGRHSRMKFRFVLLVLLPLVVMVLGMSLLPIAYRVAWQGYMMRHQPELDLFVQDLLRYERIREMSDGGRYYKTLNGRVFDGSHRVVESPDFPPLVPVLAAERVDPVQYERFRRRLIRLGFSEVEVTATHVALLEDGFLDNLHGILWVRPRATPPAEGRRVFRGELLQLRDLGNSWFEFSTK